MIYLGLPLTEQFGTSGADEEKISSSKEPTISFNGSAIMNFDNYISTINQ